MEKVSWQAKIGLRSAGDDRAERDRANENFSSCMEMQESCLCSLPCVKMSSVSWCDWDELVQLLRPRLLTERPDHPRKWGTSSYLRAEEGYTQPHIETGYVIDTFNKLKVSLFLW